MGGCSVTNKGERIGDLLIYLLTRFHTRTHTRSRPVTHNHGNYHIEGGRHPLLRRWLPEVVARHRVYDVMRFFHFSSPVRLFRPTRCLQDL